MRGRRPLLPSHQKPSLFPRFAASLCLSTLTYVVNSDVRFQSFKAIALADEISSGGPLGTYFLTSDMAHSGTGG